jgi:hypothetical protein
MQEPVMVSALPEKKEEKLQRQNEEEMQAKQEDPVLNKILCKEEPVEKVQATLNNIVRRSQEEQVDAKQETVAENNTYQITSGKNVSLHQSDILRQSGRGPPVSPISFEQTLSSSKGSGSALPGDTRQFMESRFNADFSGIRIHAGSTAEHLSSSVNAQAFTHGNDIYFNKGKFSPHSADGRALLAHELTHTIQQGGGKSNITRKNSAPAASGKITTQASGSGQGHGHRGPPAAGTCPANITFSTGNFPVHIPLCGIANVTAVTVPANIPGINWTLAAGTAPVATGTSISNTGVITFGATQAAGTIQVTADQPSAAGGRTCSFHNDLVLHSHPAAISSTFVVGAPATHAAQNYGAVFNHNFTSADGQISSIENVGVGEEFIGVPNATGVNHVIPTTPFGPFNLHTANLTNNAGNNWFITGGNLNGNFDTATIGRAGINVGRFLRSASNPTPAVTLPAGFTLVQGLHWFCRQAAAGGRWTQFARVDHTRTLRLTGTGVEFVVSVNHQDNVDDYTGHPAIINAAATPATIPFRLTARRGTPTPPAQTTTITADSRPDPLPGGHALRFNIQGPAFGCTINATTGVLTAGSRAGVVRVRVHDSARANPNFDEVDVTLVAPPPPAPAPAQAGP